MPFKDPEKNREYMREYHRARRAGLPMKPVRKALSPEDTRTARGMLAILGEQIAILRTLKADPFIKARCIAFVVSVGLRAVDTADIEARLTALESRLNGGQPDEPENETRTAGMLH